MRKIQRISRQVTASLRGLKDLRSQCLSLSRGRRITEYLEQGEVEMSEGLRGGIPVSSARPAGATVGGRLEAFTSADVPGP
jgi:hypothetical protein